MLENENRFDSLSDREDMDDYRKVSPPPRFERVANVVEQIAVKES